MIPPPRASCGPGWSRSHTPSCAGPATVPGPAPALGASRHRPRTPDTGPHPPRFSATYDRSCPARPDHRKPNQTRPRTSARLEEQTPGTPPPHRQEPRTGHGKAGQQEADRLNGKLRRSCFESTSVRCQPPGALHDDGLLDVSGIMNPAGTPFVPPMAGQNLGRHDVRSGTGRRRDRRTY